MDMDQGTPLMTDSDDEEGAAGYDPNRTVRNYDRQHQTHMEMNIENILDRANRPPDQYDNILREENADYEYEDNVNGYWENIDNILNFLETNPYGEASSRQIADRIRERLDIDNARRVQLELPQILLTDIAAAPAPVAAAPPVAAAARPKSRRVMRVEAFVPDDCGGQKDPIIPGMTANFKLEADGRCYNVRTLIDIRRTDTGDGNGSVQRSPFTRKPFTAEDSRRLSLAAGAGFGLGGNKTTRKSRKGKKSRKSRKGKNSRKSKKTVRRGKSRKLQR
jgi:hypothetical protein